MKITTPFDIGDSIWLCRYEYKKCPTCGHSDNPKTYIEQNTVKRIEITINKQYSSSGGCLGEYTTIYYYIHDDDMNISENPLIHVFKTKAEAEKFYGVK